MFLKAPGRLVGWSRRDPRVCLRPGRDACRNRGTKGALLRSRRHPITSRPERGRGGRCLWRPGGSLAPGGRRRSDAAIRARGRGQVAYGGVRRGHAVAGLRPDQARHLRGDARRPETDPRAPIPPQHSPAPERQTRRFPDGPRHPVPPRTGQARARHPGAGGRVRRSRHSRRRRAREARPRDAPPCGARARLRGGGVPGDRRLRGGGAGGVGSRDGGHRRYDQAHPPEVSRHRPPGSQPRRGRPSHAATGCTSPDRGCIDAIATTPTSAYSAAQAGRHALTKNLAIELAKDNIRVNTVALAFVETPAYERFMAPEEARAVLDSVNTFHPLGRHGQPEDVVEAILFLASVEAGWITGTTLPIDGGVLAGRSPAAARERGSTPLSDSSAQ